MKYYKNDIVEIITSKYKSYEDVPKHEIVYYTNQGKSVPFIGQRFKVDIVTPEYVANWTLLDFDIYIEKRFVTLYKRPLINHIKAFFKLKK